MRTTAATVCCLLLTVTALTAAELPTKPEVKALADKATVWLLNQQQKDGSFLPGDRFKLGITTVVGNALLDNGVPPENEAVQRAAKLVSKYVRPDGGIYDPNEGLATYGTALGLKLLVRTGYATDEIKKKAQAFLLGLQNTDPDSGSYGGIGYGERGEGNEDLSNTAMAVEALALSGLDKDDPGMERALKFLERCQNLSETNDQPWAGRDGGAVYSPDSSMALGSFHDGRENVEKPKAGESGGAKELNSYGSMTYALLTSYIYLDLGKDDPRLKAALDWAQKNYQFNANPGMPSGKERQGLFYYFQAMAKTFDLLDLNQLQVDDGTADWRADLFAAIKQRAQEIPAKAGGRPMAFWINEAPRWGEGIPHLTTAYVLSCLGRIHASLPE